MLELGAIVAAIKDTAKELTNLVGLIERNIASYDRLKANYLRKRTRRRLSYLLETLTSWRGKQGKIIFRLGELITKRRGVDSLRLDKHRGPSDAFEMGWAHPYHDADEELRSFFKTLISTRRLVSEFRRDIISVDYKLFQELEDAIDQRMELIGVLLESEGGKELSPQKLRALYRAYSMLVASIEGLKSSLQEASRSTAGGKQFRHKAISKSKRSAKKRKLRRNAPSPPRSRRLPVQE
jgi:hypothetical protein